MTYQDNKPEANDVFKQSQGDIQGNFAELKTYLETNHGDLGTTSDGKHKFVQLTEQTASPATTSTENALYTKNLGTVPAPIMRLFLRQQSSGQEITLSGPDVTNPTTADGGSSFLPAIGKGLIFKYGKAAVPNGADSVTVTITGAPFSGTAWGVLATANANAGDAYVVWAVPQNTTQFLLKISKTTVGLPCSYIAFGAAP